MIIAPVIPLSTQQIMKRKNVHCSRPVLSPVTMPPPRTLLLLHVLCCWTNHQYKSRAVPCRARSAGGVLEKGSAKTARDHRVASGGMGKVSSLCGRRTYEPRRLPFPAPEETLILLATCAKPVSLSASLLALCKACFRSSILFLETSS